MAMSERSLHDAIRATEGAEPEEQQALLCFIAGRTVRVDEAELGQHCGARSCSSPQAAIHAVRSSSTGAP